MENIDLSIVEKNYSIKIEYVKQIKTNAFFLKTRNSNYFLKWSRVDKNKVDFIIELYEYLKSTDFKSHLIDFEKTCDGGFYLLDKEKRIYILCKWIDGRTANYKDKKDVGMVIEILNKLHMCTIGFKTSRKDKVLSTYEKIFRSKYSQMIFIKDILYKKEVLTRFDKIFLKVFKLFEDRFTKSIIMARKLEHDFEKTNQKVLIHHDPAHHNFLIDNNRLYLIDFDYSAIDYNVHDFANLSLRILKTNEWDINMLQYIIRYIQKIGINNNIWFEVYFLLMFFPQEIWQVGIQYYYEHQPWSEEYFIKRLVGAFEIQNKKEMVLSKIMGVSKFCL